ncbi:hypothetical protein ACS0TY_023649 [Phlomoides rotata]
MGIFPFTKIALKKKCYKDFVCTIASQVTPPVAKRDKFSLSQCPKTDLEVQEMQKVPYASVVGSLMYAQVCTRSDLDPRDKRTPRDYDPVKSDSEQINYRLKKGLTASSPDKRQQANKTILRTRLTALQAAVTLVIAYYAIKTR